MYIICDNHKATVNAHCHLTCPFTPTSLSLSPIHFVIFSFSFFGSAPLMSSTLTFPLKKRNVGIEETPCLAAISYECKIRKNAIRLLAST